MMSLSKYLYWTDQIRQFKAENVCKVELKWVLYGTEGKKSLYFIIF